MQDLYCEKVKFLEKMGIKDAKLNKLQADASFRHYERINPSSIGKILMVAPPEKEDMQPFIKIAKILEEHKLTPPHIYGFDKKEGLMLLKDFGDNLFSGVIKNNPALEEELYLNATQVLLHLESLEIKGKIDNYTNTKLVAEAELLTQWAYKDISSKAKQEYNQIWQKLVEQISQNRIMVLRDFHADNLMWLKEGKEFNTKVGLLDFQDAVYGSPAYDLLSLLEDARRDVKEETVAKCYDYFLQNTKFNKEEITSDYNILAAQRNCKIIGIFKRLKVRDGKDNYIKLLPRVINHLQKDLERKELKELKQWFNLYIPEICA